jgi:hypothetical protein
VEDWVWKTESKRALTQKIRATCRWEKILKFILKKLVWRDVELIHLVRNRDNWRYVLYTAKKHSGFIKFVEVLE